MYVRTIPPADGEHEVRLRALPGAKLLYRAEEIALLEGDDEPREIGPCEHDILNVLMRETATYWEVTEYIGPESDERRFREGSHSDFLITRIYGVATGPGGVLREIDLDAFYAERDRDAQQPDDEPNEAHGVGRQW